jgi:hypothetical protein
MEICSLQRLQLDDGVYRETCLEHCAVSVNGTSDALGENQISLKRRSM